MLQADALCRLETDIQTLEQHLESMRAAYQLNQEKLDYNYRVLLERDAENQATITQQKRKVSKQRDLLSTLMVLLPTPPCTVHLSLSVSHLSVCLLPVCLAVCLSACVSIYMSVMQLEAETLYWFWQPQELADKCCGMYLASLQHFKSVVVG